MRPTSLLILFPIALGLGGAPGYADRPGTEDPIAEDAVTEEVFLAVVDSTHPASRHGVFRPRFWRNLGSILFARI
jgi:hypothetical protein